jgi:hypothetical protein
MKPSSHTRAYCEGDANGPARALKFSGVEPQRAGSNHNEQVIGSSRGGAATYDPHENDQTGLTFSAFPAQIFAAGDRTAWLRS